MTKAEIIEKAMERLDKLCQTLDLVEARKILEEVIPEDMVVTEKAKRCEDCMIGIGQYNDYDEFVTKERERGMMKDDKHYKMKEHFNFCPICGRKL